MVALYAGAADLIQEHAAEASGGPLTVEGGLMVWTVVVFLLLLLVLKRFAWPAILGAVEAREQALEAQLVQATKDRGPAAGGPAGPGAEGRGGGGGPPGRAQAAGGRRPASGDGDRGRGPGRG